MKSSFKKPMKEIVDRVDLKDLGTPSVLLDDREVRKIKAQGIGTREVIESCFYGYLYFQLEASPQDPSCRYEES